MRKTKEIRFIITAEDKTTNETETKVYTYLWRNDLSLEDILDAINEAINKIE